MDYCGERRLLGLDLSRARISCHRVTFICIRKFLSRAQRMMYDASVGGVGEPTLSSSPERV